MSNSHSPSSACTDASIENLYPDETQTMSLYFADAFRDAEGKGGRETDIAEYARLANNNPNPEMRLVSQKLAHRMIMRDLFRGSPLMAAA